MRRPLALALLLLAPVLLGADPDASAKAGAGGAEEQTIELPTREEERTKATYALEIQAREQALAALAADIEAKLEALARLREETTRSIAESEEQHQAELGRLVAFYTSMKPKNAARLLEELPLGLASEVIASMKARSAGKILDSMESARAVQISRRVAGN